MHPFNTPAVDALISLALQEDLGAGDVTAQTVIGPDRVAQAELVARQDLTVAGLPLAARVFQRVDPTLAFFTRTRDGDAVPTGAVLADIKGTATAVLAAERTALNFLQRLSGVATQTRRFVDAAAGKARIADTRKTTPGYRALEKYAVRAGGGHNHRADLGAGILIKDNHIAVAGSVAKAIRHARAGAPHGLKVQVEVDNLAQLDEALATGCDIVLLDNFNLDDIKTAVAAVRARSPGTLVEVSGGVTLDQVAAIANTGVDVISVGALTHSAAAVDIALDIHIEGTAAL